MHLDINELLMVSLHIGLPKAGQDRNDPRRESSVLVYGLYSTSKLVNKTTGASMRYDLESFLALPGLRSMINRPDEPCGLNLAG